MPIHLLVKLGIGILADRVFDRLAVLALWERARKTPGKLDDALVSAAALALGVTLPETPGQASDKERASDG